MTSFKSLRQKRIHNSKQCSYHFNLPRPEMETGLKQPNIMNNLKSEFKTRAEKNSLIGGVCGRKMFFVVGSRSKTIQPPFHANLPKAE